MKTSTAWTDKLLADIKALPAAKQVRYLAKHARQLEAAHRKQTAHVERFHRAVAA